MVDGTTDEKPAAGLNHENLKTPEAADYLRLKPGTLDQWRWLGVGPRYARCGRRIVYRKADLDAYLEQCSRQSTSER